MSAEDVDAYFDPNHEKYREAATWKLAGIAWRDLVEGKLRDWQRGQKTGEEPHIALHHLCR
jgi:hypothetical protein